MPKLEESETAINQNQKKNSEVTPKKATSFCGNKKNRTNTAIFPHASRAMEDVTKPSIPLIVSTRKNILQQSTTIHKQPYVSERFVQLTNGQQVRRNGVGIWENHAVCLMSLILPQSFYETSKLTCKVRPSLWTILKKIF
jgi:hypothetical protein